MGRLRRGRHAGTLAIIGAGTSVGFVERTLAARGLQKAASGLKAAGGVLAVCAGLYLLLLA